MNHDSAPRALETAPPEDILRWAVAEFAPDVAMSSSFQTQSLPLLHMVSRVAPSLPVIFLDTGYHFPETLRFRDRLVKEWGLELVVARPHPDEARPGLYAQDPDRCCQVHKVEPMRHAMRGLRAWISGVRRDQTDARSGLRVVERTNDLVRIHPLAGWTSRDVWSYIDRYDLPAHPLFSQGYVSIGCAPCTRPVQIGMDERSGRWAGRGKTECGLHTTMREADEESA